MDKMKIGFFISTKTVQHSDLSSPESGNPGIGATEYLFVLIASQIGVRFNNSMEIVFICDSNCKLPSYLKHVQVIDALDAVTTAKRLEVDILVLRSIPDAKLFKHIDKVEQKVVMWSHNRIWAELAGMIANSKYVVRNICVGVRQALELIDHDIYKKTNVIYNPAIINKRFIREVELPTVTYIGHLNKSRGFHLLAKIWKDVIKEIPNAQLNVIGSAALYNRDIVLGTLGVASEDYEKRFIKYIVSDNGGLLPSVHFHGIMGQEKLEIYGKTSVGIINPIGYETLGISGIEMQACGIPLVTINKYGQSEIVKHNHTGYLFNNSKQFAKYIVKLLSDKQLNIEMGENAREYMNQKFGLDNILLQWKDEFESILIGYPMKQLDIHSMTKTKIERVKIFNSKLRNKKIFTWVPPIINVQTAIIKIIKKL